MSYYVTQDELDTADAVFRTTTRYFNRFDALGWEHTSLINSDAAWTLSRDFDARGRLVKQFVPYLTTQSDLGSRRLSYDLLDRVVTDALYTSAGAQERSTSVAYTGLSTTVTDPLTHETTRVASAWGDVVSVTDAMTGTMSHEYNAFGQLKQTRDAANNLLATVTYNLRGFRTELADLDLGTWTFTPNALGEVVSQTDAESQETDFEYDKLGRMLSRDEPGSTTDATWTWGDDPDKHEIGRLRSVSLPGYSDSFEYDTAGRPKKRTIVADATYVYDYAYNGIGELHTLTYPVSTAGVRFKLKYLYNNGHLEAIRQFTGDVDNTTYWALNALNARGQPIDEVYGNGLWLQSSFKALTGQIATRQSGTGGSASNVQDLLYTWDTADNLTEREDLRQPKVESFTYDPLHRLTQASGPGGTLVIGYDAIGNITSRSDVGGGAGWSYHASKKHAVTAAGGVSYGYDANGRMTSRAGATVSWTAGQQPAQINGGGYTAAFDYAPDRARWRQVSSYAGTSETTIYVGGLMEKLTTPSKTEYKHLIPTPSGFVQAIRRVGGYTATHYLAGDHLGSVDAVLNSTGGVMVRTSFAAFGARRDDDWHGLPSGAELSQIAGTSRRGFTGHEMLDNVGLIHMNGRVHDPALGRFMSADPFIDQALGPQGFNRYAYVGNNPLSATDPSGFDTQQNQCRDCSPVPWQLRINFLSTGPSRPPLLFNGSQIHWGSNHTPAARPRPPAVRDPGPPAPASCVSQMCDDANVSTVDGAHRGPQFEDWQILLPFTMLFTLEDYSIEQLPNELQTPAQIASIIFGAGKFKVGAKGVASLDDLARAAGVLDRGGLSAAGRQLQKHGSRPGSAFPSARGNPTAINQQAQDIVEDILTTPGTTTLTRHHARFGDVIEIRTPDGRGVRYSSDGRFIGFLEP